MLKTVINNNFPPDNCKSIFDIHENQHEQFINNTKKHSEKKFNYLISNSNLNINNPMNSQSNWFLNLSNSVVPDNVANVISLGNNFKFDDKKQLNTSINYIKSVETFINNYNLNNELSNDIRNKLITNLRSHVKSNSKHINVNDLIYSKQLNNAKLFVKNHSEIFFTIADKGNVTVAMDKVEYINKIENNLLNDTKTYKIIKRNPLNKLKTDTYKILKYWNNSGFLNRKYYDLELTQTNTNIAKLYGLPKIHKINVPLRPVVSTVNSPTYFLSKHLFDLLDKSINKPKSYIQNSSDFIKKITQFTIPTDHTLISLDVSSLFTNVGSEHVRDSIIKRYITISRNLNIPLDDLLNACQFLFDNNFFKFNDKYYQQIYGTPMGSSISGLFADIVMEDLETICLSKLSFKPLFFYRYVDDIITCIPADKINEIVDKFNGYDERLQFTFEMLNNNSINFLDVLIIIDNKKLITDWFLKPTFSGRTINYKSKHPFSQKVAIVYNLIDRAVKLSDKQFHSKNIQFVEQLLLNNNYPIEFIRKYTKKRISFINLNKHNDSNGNNYNNNRTIYNMLPKVFLPYVPNLFENVSFLLKNYNILTIPISNINMSHNLIVKYKDKNKKTENTNTVYKINCHDCSASYVGQSKRMVGVRINEHKNSKDNIVAHHCDSLKHRFDFVNFAILDREDNYKKRLISEMIYINLQINPINKRDDIQNLNNYYTHFLNENKYS
ncbi:protein dopey homolog PFC0245c-like [Leptopilina heterotoma]|uniref:protein dopey homolog PFC0245c-like n=1 Tax=Leptopilina heterotoma TaxID=63436 RepID=UPI001CA80D6A|nr:protein dopey homolog PFC0245c-like [Leptopilina heterotoma]